MDSAALLYGLGGPQNVASLEGAQNRLRFEISDPARVDAGVIREAGAIGVVRQKHSVQVICETAVDDCEKAVRALLTEHQDHESTRP